MEGDFAAFKAKVEAGRRVEHTVGGVKFQLTLPTERDSRLAFEDTRDALGAMRYNRAFNVLLTNAIAGWSGLTFKHLDGEGGAEQVPFSEEARAMLLEVRGDIVDELGQFVGSRMKERRERLEACAKN